MSSIMNNEWLNCQNHWLTLRRRSQKLFMGPCNWEGRHSWQYSLKNEAFCNVVHLNHVIQVIAVGEVVSSPFLRSFLAFFWHWHLYNGQSCSFFWTCLSGKDIQPHYLQEFPGANSMELLLRTNFLSFL